MSWLVDQPIAHRGLHGPQVPEHSTAAFQQALDADYAIECDIRLTQDGVPVVFHDRTLNRLTNQTGYVEDMAWDTISGCTLGQDARILSFAEVLDLVDGDVPLLVEVKNEGFGHALETAVGTQLHRYDGPFAIQSFNPISLAYFNHEYPSWPRGQLAGGLSDVEAIAGYSKAMLNRLLLTWMSRPDFIAYEHQSLPYWPVSLHRAFGGRPILAWTVRSVDGLEHATNHADNVIFESVRP